MNGINISVLSKSLFLKVVPSFAGEGSWCQHLARCILLTLENGTNIFKYPAQSFVNERGNLVKGYITSIGSRYVFDFNYFTRDTC